MIPEASESDSEYLPIETDFTQRSIPLFSSRRHCIREGPIGRAAAAGGHRSASILRGGGPDAVGARRACRRE